MEATSCSFTSCTGLVASSFTHPDFPRADETFTFTDVIGINNFRLEFCWLATTAFMDLDEDLELCRVSIDASNYIRLVAVAGVEGTNRFQREYNNNDVHGPHDPIFRLEKVRLGSSVATTDVVSYWGYDLRDPSAERSDDVIKFTLTHMAEALFELRVERYGNEGNTTSTDDLTAFTDPCASILYTGQGWFGTPVIVEENRAANGRKLPTGRKDLAGRIRALNKPQVLAGDRDPTGGQIVKDLIYKQGDDFLRGDSSSLGGDWENSAVGPYFQTGAGWNIVSDQASCTDDGFQRWDFRPQHADVIITADISISTTGDRVGLIARWEDGFRDTGLSLNGLSAYGAELEETGPTDAEINIVRWHKGVRVELATTAISYTSGETLELVFTLLGSSLTATITGRDTAIATDTNYQFPKKVGIYGQTGGSTIILDNWNVASNFNDETE